nr:hypothetical protein [Tanacetum cinerariifolium]
MVMMHQPNMVYCILRNQECREGDFRRRALPLYSWFLIADDDDADDEASDDEGNDMSCGYLLVEIYRAMFYVPG